MLLPIHGLFEPAEAAEILHSTLAGDWLDGAVSAGSQAASVKRNRQLDAGTDLTCALGARLVASLRANPLFMSAALPAKIYPPMFNRYGVGETYGAHVDGAIMSSGNPAELMRTDLSLTVFLSEPDQYEGGELIVQTSFGDQAVKLNAGDGILYPSTSLHRVSQVISGERICAVLWVQSLVRSGEQRELLFELDQSIQALSVGRGAGDGEVRRLSGIYHNLVRQWSQT